MTHDVRWRKVHPETFAAMYAAGTKMKVIARTLGCSVTSLKAMRKTLNLEPRKSGYEMANAATKKQRPEINLCAGDVVLIETDNLTFNGLLGVVAEPTVWGAHVDVWAYHAGKPPTKTKYRAACEELHFIGPLPPTGGQVLSHPEKSAPIEKAEPQTDETRALGYTGDVCVKCMGCRMRRNGTCLVCSDCGETTGCA